MRVQLLGEELVGKALVDEQLQCRARVHLRQPRRVVLLAES
jgi:hypothetical protein